MRFISNTLIFLLLTPALGATTVATHLSPNALSLQLSYEAYDMPDNLQHLGVGGLTLLWHPNDNWYAGPGINGGMSGDHGGYFALNADGGYRHELYGPIWFNLGSKVGAGGGRSTPVGGGLYVEPHAGLLYHNQYIDIGANYSYVNFTSGDIKSQQLEVTLAVPFTAYTADYSYAGTMIDVDSASVWLNHNYFELLGEIDLPKPGTKNVYNQLDDDHFELVGIEFGHYFSDNGFVFIRGLGAIHGHSNGYAAMMTGPGYRIGLTHNQQLNLLARVGIGSAGGADIDTGGGFIVEPMLGLEYYFNEALSAEVAGGYVFAPNGHFAATSISAGIGYHFNIASESYAADNQASSTQVSYQGWRIRLANETYFKPKTNDGKTHFETQLFNTNVDFWLNHCLYFTGQAAFAYAGANTGGYFTGLMGFGAQMPLIGQTLSVYGEALAGAAGGAGLDIGDGLMLEPLLGLNIQVGSNWAVQLSAGQLMATKGDFNSTVANIGIAYSFSTLG